MGLFQNLFGGHKEPKNPQGYYKTLTAYTPVFTTWGSEIYENQQVKAAIDAIARNVSKLKVEFVGDDNSKLRWLLEKAPNEWQTWSQFLYRLATILYATNTAYIVPVYSQYGQITGMYPLYTNNVEIVQYNDEPYLKYRFVTGDTASIRLKDVGIITRFQFKSDFFGDTQNALMPTMGVIDIQNQGINEGVKNSATFRFMARMTNFVKPEDLPNEKKRFTRENLEDGDGGVLLFPNTWSDIKQIDSKPYVVDSATMQLIDKNIQDYFGVNEDILQNKAFGDAWSAFYEGCIEWFAVQTSEVLTKMLYTLGMRSRGNEVRLTANRLQYMSNKDKFNFSVAAADRGAITVNEFRELWSLPPVDGGDIRILRGEYYNADTGDKVNADGMSVDDEKGDENDG